MSGPKPLSHLLFCDEVFGGEWEPAPQILCPVLSGSWPRESQHWLTVVLNADGHFQSDGQY